MTSRLVTAMHVDGGAQKSASAPTTRWRRPGDARWVARDTLYRVQEGGSKAWRKQAAEALIREIRAASRDWHAEARIRMTGEDRLCLQLLSEAIRDYLTRRLHRSEVRYASESAVEFLFGEHAQWCNEICHGLGIHPRWFRRRIRWLEGRAREQERHT